LFCRFVDYYYPMGEAIFRTGLLVEGFLYSPFSAILLAVFPPFELDASLFLWGFLQVLFVSLYVLLFRRLVPAGLPIQLLFVALTITSYPLLFNLLAGQVSFKYYPIIFLAPFAARPDPTFAFSFSLPPPAARSSWWFPLFSWGGGDTLRFYGSLLDAFRDSGWVVENPHSQYFPHVVLRLAGGAGLDIQAQLHLLRWIGFGVAAANMGLVFLAQRARLRYADLWSLQLVFLTRSPSF
jgi:hypothetical protein